MSSQPTQFVGRFSSDKLRAANAVGEAIAELSDIRARLRVLRDSIAKAEETILELEEDEIDATASANLALSTFATHT